MTFENEIGIEKAGLRDKGKWDVDRLSKECVRSGFFAQETDCDFDLDFDENLEDPNNKPR